MRDHASFVVTEGVKPSRSPKRLAVARAAVVAAAQDFIEMWPRGGSVAVVSVGDYAGRPVVTISIGSRNYIVNDGDYAELVVNIVRLLQAVITDDEARWPDLPGFGTLTPSVRSGCAIWALPDGTEFCEIGQLLTRFPV